MNAFRDRGRFDAISDQLSPRSVLAKISPSVVPAKKPNARPSHERRRLDIAAQMRKGECFHVVRGRGCARPSSGRHRSYARRRSGTAARCEDDPVGFRRAKHCVRISNPHLGVCDGTTCVPRRCYT